MTPAASITEAEGAKFSSDLPNLVAFCFCFCLLAAAFILKPKPVGEGRLRLGGVTLPQMCMMKATTGVGCPGCGLSRSWVAAAHGDWSASRAFHPLGWLVMLYTAAQMVRHGMWLWVKPVRGVIKRISRPLDYGLAVLSILLLAVWVIRLF